MNRISMQPLGFDGVRERMRELRTRIEEKIGPAESFSLPPAESSSPLTGEISALTGHVPFQPFGQGLELESTMARGEIEGMIGAAAQKVGIDEDLLHALVQTESAFDPMARSRAGAMGLTQLMPGTAKELGVSNPFDPQENLMGGARYLARMIDRFGNLPEALAAYNAGPGAVSRAGGIPPYAETQKYVQKVMALYQKRQSE